MIYQLNTGNILPFFEKLENQIGRREDISSQFGLPCPRYAFLPFQFISQIPIATFSWSYVNLCEPDTVVALPSEYLTKHCTTETGPQFVTYNGDVIWEEDFDCGNYYLILTVNGVDYYSEVMNLDSICDEIHHKLEITGCALEPVIGGDGVRFTFATEGRTGKGVNSILNEYDTGSGFATGTTFALLKSIETAEIRITVNSDCGSQTWLYELEWYDADPCGTYFLTDITND